MTMGRLNHDQGQPFYSFCLEEVVPDDHLVREIAAVLPVIGPRRTRAPRRLLHGAWRVDLNGRLAGTVSQEDEAHARAQIAATEEAGRVCLGFIKFCASAKFGRADEADLDRRRGAS
jgi:hypothetical protein